MTSSFEEHSKQVEDRLPYRKLISAAVIFLIAATAVVIWAWRILVGGAGTAYDPGGVPPPVGQAEIGMVIQEPFYRFAGGEALRVEQEKRLSSYGWVDKEKGVAHMPIERAMDLYLKR